VEGRQPFSLNPAIAHAKTPRRPEEVLIIVPATEACGSAFRPTDWERRTPVRPGLSATGDATVVCEIAPHWGAALPVAGMMIEAPEETKRSRGLSVGWVERSETHHLR
jgi:hypothetical protein